MTNTVFVARGKAWEISRWSICKEDAQEIDSWLRSLPEGMLDELGGLLAAPRIFPKGMVLSDWVLENGGKLWYHWCLSAWWITHYYDTERPNTC